MIRSRPRLKAAIFLPGNDFIDKSLLLAGSTSKIDTGCLNAFMSHKVSKQSNVVVLLQEVLGIAMPEGMRVYDFLIQTVFFSIVLELLRDATGGNPLSISVKKQIAGGTVRFLQP